MPTRFIVPSGASNLGDFVMNDFGSNFVVPSVATKAESSCQMGFAIFEPFTGNGCSYTRILSFCQSKWTKRTSPGRVSGESAFPFRAFNRLTIHFTWFVARIVKLFGLPSLNPVAMKTNLMSVGICPLQSAELRFRPD